MHLPKWPFAFLQRNAKFYSCTHTAIRYFTVKYEILQVYSNGHQFFYSEMQNFETLPKQPFRFFYNERQNFKNCAQTAIRFLQRNTEF